MLKLEIESDRDVLVDGIGLLSAGQPLEVTEDMRTLFKAYNGVELVGANFPPYVTVTASFAEAGEGDK